MKSVLKHMLVGGVITCIVLVIYISLSIFALKDITGVIFALMPLIPVSLLLDIVGFETIGPPLIITSVIVYFFIGSIIGTSVYLMRRTKK